MKTGSMNVICFGIVLVLFGLCTIDLGMQSHWIMLQLVGILLCIAGAAGVVLAVSDMRKHHHKT